MFKEAKNLGTKLVVIINNDYWLTNKKGYVFMKQEDRKEIIEGFACVDKVTIHHPCDKEDKSVCDAIADINPNIFANGGDRKPGNIPEYSLCNYLGIEMMFSVGGEKIRSSSDMVKNSKWWKNKEANK